MSQASHLAAESSGSETQSESENSSWYWRALSPAVFALAVLLGGFLLYRSVSQYEPSELLSSITNASPYRLLAALAFAAASYLCLTGFDWLALRYVGRQLPYRRAALASFTALSLGHNIGFAALSSGAIRYRFYSRWGLSGFEVAKIILFCGVTVGLGLASLAGVVMVLQPSLAGKVMGLSAGTVTGLGLLLLAVPLLYVGAAVVGVGTLRFRRWSLELPPPKLALLQIGLGTLNFSLVAACLHQALNAIGEVAYPPVAATYVIANAATLISHVPGGLGVIESTILFLLPGQSSLAAVLLFRAAYFLVPLCLGLLTFLLYELLSRRRSAASPG